MEEELGFLRNKVSNLESAISFLGGVVEDKLMLGLAKLFNHKLDQITKQKHQLQIEEELYRSLLSCCTILSPTETPTTTATTINCVQPASPAPASVPVPQALAPAYKRLKYVVQGRRRGGGSGSGRDGRPAKYYFPSNTTTKVITGGPRPTPTLPGSAAGNKSLVMTTPKNSQLLPEGTSISMIVDLEAEEEEEKQPSTSQTLPTPPPPATVGIIINNNNRRDIVTPPHPSPASETNFDPLGNDGDETSYDVIDIELDDFNEENVVKLEAESLAPDHNIVLLDQSLMDTDKLKVEDVEVDVFQPIVFGHERNQHAPTSAVSVGAVQNDYNVARRKRFYNYQAKKKKPICHVNPADVTYSTTRHGKPLILVGGYKYTRNNVSNNTTSYWNCIDMAKYKCPSKVILQRRAGGGGQVRNVHNHLPRHHVQTQLGIRKS